jgi:hypothetical protein
VQTRNPQNYLGMHGRYFPAETQGSTRYCAIAKSEDKLTCVPKGAQLGTRCSPTRPLGVHIGWFLKRPMDDLVRKTSLDRFQHSHNDHVPLAKHSTFSKREYMRGLMKSGKYFRFFFFQSQLRCYLHFGNKPVLILKYKVNNSLKR